MEEEQPWHRLADLVLGFEGLAIMRNFWMRPDVVKARVGEIEEILKLRDADEDLSIRDRVEEIDLVAGYDRWASTYDRPGNPIVLADARLLSPVLNELDGLIADVACGTGRHAAYLQSLGKDVVGLDRSLAMVGTAVRKGLRVAQGDVEALPLPDDLLDAALCSLALAHFEDLVPPLRELARVVRGGGRLVLSDLHPVTIATGAHASFEDASGSRAVMRNYLHPHSAYLKAFEQVGLQVMDCLETVWTEEEEIQSVELERFPGLMQAALGGLPIVLGWDLRVK
jgi:SAM-dependent methyltransferase